jgi:ankyrin repeat protein
MPRDETGPNPAPTSPLELSMKNGHVAFVAYFLANGVWDGADRGLKEIDGKQDPKFLAIREKVLAIFPLLKTYPDAPFAQVGFCKQIEKNQNLLEKYNGSESKGCCHGLSTLWSYYRLQGKSADFFKNLHQISTSEASAAPLTKDLVQFVNDIIFLQQPVSQPHSPALDHWRILENIDSIKRDTDPAIALEGELSGVFNLHELEKFLQDSIHENQMTILAIPKHTLAVFKENDHYVFYDSNLPYGEVVLPSIKNLAKSIQAIYAEQSNDAAKLIPLAAKFYTRRDSCTTTRHFNLDDYVPLAVAKNRTTQDGITALSMAVNTSDYATARSLLKAGATVDNKTWDCARKDTTMVKIILEHLHPDKIKRRGLSALNQAILEKDKDLVQLLLKAGATITATTRGFASRDEAMAEILQHYDNSHPSKDETRFFAAITTSSTNSTPPRIFSKGTFSVL